MKIKVETECGDKTCAVKPRVFCLFLRIGSFGQGAYCSLYCTRLLDLGWIQRCDKCLEEHKEE